MAVDVDRWSERFLVFVASVCIPVSVVRPASIGHECPGRSFLSQHDDSGMCDACLLVCREFVGVLSDFSVVARLSVRCLFHRVGKRVRLFVDVVFGRMECDAFFVLEESHALSDGHAERHEFVSVWLAVAEPCGHAVCKLSVSQFLNRELREMGELPLLQLRYFGSGEEVEHDGEGRDEERDDYDVEFVVHVCLFSLELRVESLKFKVKS